MTEPEQYRPDEPHPYTPFSAAGPGCRWCGGTAVTGMHLRWTAAHPAPIEPEP